MKNAPRTILVVDDDPCVGLVLAGLLEQAGFHATHVDRASLALSVVRQCSPDLVVTDLRMPEMDGMALLSVLRRDHPRTPVVMLTAHGDVAVAVEAMKRGAADFVTKPFDRQNVLAVIRGALPPDSSGVLHRSFDPTNDVVGLAQTVAVHAGGVSNLLGDSPAMEDVRRLIDRAARSCAHVLVRGESGSGKEVVARAIHASGPRRSGPFVAVHCAAIPEDLLESELFGYERGAFTGAAARKPGRVELAERGTLFLDEIGDVSPTTQVKLLRLLQERTYQPLGATREVRADVRFIAATHRDLGAMVRAEEFREDLYYRLDVLPVWVPALRDRGDDITALARTFCSRASAENGRATRFTEAALARLSSYGWPGNVRELHSLVERLVVFSDLPEISTDEVERELSLKRGFFHGGPGSDELTMSARRTDAEQRAVVEALERAGGNRVKAAQLLGVSRRTLYNRLTRQMKSA